VDTLQTQYGCDSIIHLNLEIKNDETRVRDLTVCEGEEVLFGGRRLTSSGTYVDSLQAVSGCDSIEILNLTILPNTRDTLRATICEGMTYIFDGRELSTSGVYRDTMQGEPCQDIFVLILTVTPNNLVLDLGEDETIKLGEDYQFDPFIFPPNSVINYMWSPNDGFSCDDCPNPWVTPTETTIYTLKITDENGCMISDQIEIRVNTNVDIYIPNVFTPNGDNINDFFYIQSGEGVELIELLEIYDRWGERVFMIRDFLPNIPGLGWDGTFRGMDMDPAVFVYSAIVRLENGQKVILKGDITLVR
jgi:gliding motility-associated-like protein